MSERPPAGKLVDFNPQGTYLRPITDERPPGPSVIRLADIGAQPGDYVALRGNGNWRPGTGLPPVQRVSGVFRNSARRFLAPAKSGQEAPFENWGRSPSEPGPVIAEDFNIPYDRETIVRVPKNAVEIALNSGDWKFLDNIAGPGCGVLVSLPNKQAAIPRATSGPGDEQDVAGLPDPADLYAALNSLNAADPPTATAFSASPFAKPAASDAFPQWRGWYYTSNGQGAWLPAWSRFDAQRGARVHKGWDIFSPNGGKVVAPVGPARFEWIPNVSGYGNLAAFYFKYRGATYRLFYAHLADKLATNGATVRAGDEVALSGCSGNAQDERCGAQLTLGGRTDHVHVGLVPEGPINDTTALPPDTLLRWTIRDP